MKSVIQNNKCCFICQSMSGLENHHIFFGAKNRKKSEEYGMKIWLCMSHHRGKLSPHMNINVDRHLKKIAQAEFERTYSREEFITEFGRSYL